MTQEPTLGQILRDTIEQRKRAEDPTFIFKTWLVNTARYAIRRLAHESLTTHLGKRRTELLLGSIPLAYKDTSAEQLEQWATEVENDEDIVVFFKTPLKKHIPPCNIDCTQCMRECYLIIPQ
jgi:hypothetical protein